MDIAVLHFFLNVLEDLRKLSGVRTVLLIDILYLDLIPKYSQTLNPNNKMVSKSHSLNPMSQSLKVYLGYTEFLVDHCPSYLQDGWVIGKV